MKFLLLVSTLIVTGVLCANKMPVDNPDQTAVNVHDRALITYYLSGLRGLWDGYISVFHHGTLSIDEKCFKDESAEEIMEIL